MTTQQLLKFYEPQLESLLIYAKAINFDLETGDVMQLMRSWLEQGRKFMVFAENNKDEFIRKAKSLI